MQTTTDASQDKLKIRLTISPENQSIENKGEVGIIGHDIYQYLSQVHHYRVDAIRTDHELRPMGTVADFLVWISSLSPLGIEVGKAVIGELVVELIKEILEKVRAGTYRNNEATIKIKNFPGNQDIKAHGPLEETLHKVKVDVENKSADLIKIDSNADICSATEEIEIMIIVARSSSDRARLSGEELKRSAENELE